MSTTLQQRFDALPAVTKAVVDDAARLYSDSPQMASDALYAGLPTAKYWELAALADYVRALARGDIAYKGMVANCDCCDLRPGTHMVQAYGIETWACDECTSGSLAPRK